MLARAGARRERVPESDGATGQAVCRLPRFGKLALQLAPVACILARARDATDFRPSRNGVGGACASCRTVWGSGRERSRDLAGCFRTLAFRRTHHNMCPARALTECNCHPFTVTRPLGRRFGVPQRPVSDACMCMQSTCHTPCNASTGPCTSTLRSDSRPSASRGEETLGEVAPNTAHQRNARAV